MQRKMWIGFGAVVLGLGACSETIADPSGGGAGAEPPASGGGGTAAPATGGGGHGGHGGAELPAGQCSTPVEAQPFDKGILPLYLSSIAFDRSGNVGITGVAQTRIDLGGGELKPGGAQDAIVAKFDAAGDHVFSKAAVRGVAVDANGASVIAGWTECGLDLGGGSLDTPECRRSAFVARFDAEGAHQFSRLLGSSKLSGAASLGMDRSGSAFVAGMFGGTMELDGATLTADADDGAGFVVQLSVDGSISQSRTIVGSLETIHHLAVGPEGHVAVLGRTFDDVELESGPQLGRGDFVAKLAFAAP